MARRNIGTGVLTAPLPPVMVTVKSGERVNVLTIGWTGILSTHPPRTYISVRPCRYSYELLKESGEFVINLTPATLVKKADYCGVYTGAKVDKFAKCGFDKEAATELSCPMIAESPLTLECKVTDVIELGSHHMFMADIVAVNVDDSLLDEGGKLHLERAGLSAYAHGEYFELGRKIGYFGFSADKKRRNPALKSNKKQRR